MTYLGQGTVAYRGPVTGLTYVFEAGVALEVDDRDAAALGATGKFAAV